MIIQPEVEVDNHKVKKFKEKKAKIHLSKLDDICLFGCDEYTTLKKAIEGYDKNKLEKNY